MAIMNTNFNVDSIKLSRDLIITVDGKAANLIKKSFEMELTNCKSLKQTKDPRNENDVIQMIYQKCKELDVERKKMELEE